MVRRRLTAERLGVLCRNDVEDLVSDVVGGLCVRMYDGDDPACYGYCHDDDDHDDDFSFYDDDDVRQTIKTVRSASTLSGDTRDSIERDDVSRSSSAKTTPTIEDPAAVELAAVAATTKSKAAKKAQKAAAKKKAKEDIAAAKKAKETAAAVEAQESASQLSKNDKNDNDDSVAHTPPKNLSIEEMEALQLTSKVLSAVRKYPTFADTLNGLLSFQCIDNEEDDDASDLTPNSLTAVPSKVGALRKTSQDKSRADRLDANGNSALHLSAKALNASNVSDFLLLLEDSRDSASQPNNNNDLPLHIVAATGPTGTEKAVMALVEANQTALTVRGARGKTPLHLALTEGSRNLPVLAKILAYHKLRKIGVIDFDDEGKLSCGANNRLISHDTSPPKNVVQYQYECASALSNSIYFSSPLSVGFCEQETPLFTRRSSTVLRMMELSSMVLRMLRLPRSEMSCNTKKVSLAPFIRRIAMVTCLFTQLSNFQVSILVSSLSCSMPPRLQPHEKMVVAKCRWSWLQPPTYPPASLLVSSHWTCPL